MPKKIKVLLKTPSIDDLDDLQREYIRLRDKVCRKCGKTFDLQVAHIFSKGAGGKAVRWDEDNVVLLCRKHHLYWAHKEPIEFNDWVKEQLGETKFNNLKLRAHDVSKADRSAVACYLKQRISELEKREE